MNALEWVAWQDQPMTSEEIGLVALFVGAFAVGIIIAISLICLSVKLFKSAMKDMRSGR